MAVTEPPQTAQESSKTVRLRAYRSKRADGGEHFDEHEIPVGALTTLHEALRWVQRHRAPTLSLRHSCLHGSCGTCGVRVNGREELACVCALADCGDEITIEPLANLPVLTAGCVEWDPFFARSAEPPPITRVSEPPPPSPASEGGEPYVRLEDCIE